MSLRNILVPERYVPETQKALLDRDVAHILSQNDLPIETKYMLYQNLLHQYKQMQGILKKPLKLDLVYDQPTSTISLSEFPKSVKERAKKFIEFVQNIPDIKIDNKGQVHYKNNIIRGSNFTDLVNDFVRNLKKKTRPPTGARELALALREANVPSSYIGNKNRLDLIQGGPHMFSSSSGPSSSWRQF